MKISQFFHPMHSFKSNLNVMMFYLFLGIPAKYNLSVENFHPYGVQSSKVKEGCTVFPM